jgi:hypothetical protein
MKERMFYKSDEVKERLNIKSIKAKLSADTESLKNLQVNHHANGGFTHE